MVNEKVLIKDKHRKLKKVLKVFLILLIIGIILAVAFFSGFFTKPRNMITLENPLKSIVLANTDSLGQVNVQAVIEQGILEFDEDYINYLLAALGVNSLHKSLLGYGNPVVEFNVEGEIWSSEIINGGLRTQKNSAEDPDLRISVSRQEAVLALISANVEEFMKESVYNGNTQIEMVAGKIELGSKGYLKMYTDLTGEMVEE